MEHLAPPRDTRGGALFAYVAKAEGVEHNQNCAAEKGRHVMELNPDAVVGRHCRLVRPVRDTQGKSRFSEEPVILRAVNNLGRHMYLVQFDDGSTTFLFPNEIIVQN
jgi:hypothetical protein